MGALDLAVAVYLFVRGNQGLDSANQMENAGVGLMALIVLAVALVSATLALVSGRMAWRGPPRSPGWSLLGIVLASMPGLAIASAALVLL